MSKISLVILAKDIRETTYEKSHDCAITKALQRAGYGQFEDSGIGIEDEFGGVLIGEPNKSYQIMVDTVMGMYSTKDNEDYNSSRGLVPRLPIVDREFVLEF